MGKRRRTARTRTDHGAAAVEFALVLPILLLVVFGIISYGLFFNDSINTRQGVREAARRVTVGNLTYPGCPTATTTTGGANATIKCITRSAVGALSGPAYVAVKPPATWARGSAFTICAVVKPRNVIGLIPMPSAARSFTSMSIEVDNPAPAVTASADTLPAGLSWPTGCT